MKLQNPIPFITFGDQKRILEIENNPELGNDDDPYAFQITKEAKLYLAELDSPLAVISIAGLYRTGKSYLLNLLLGDNESSAFHVGGTINACTKGIWIYGQHNSADIQNAIRKDNNETVLEKESNEQVTLILMDTEGLGSTQRSHNQDTKMFALALLLSSSFVYNSRGVIDANAIQDLSLVVHLTKYVQYHTNVVDVDLVAKTFPSFLWVVRDFTLQLVKDGKKITSKQYLDNALEPQEGTSLDTMERNKVRKVLAKYFPSRNCMTFVRPTNNEKDLKNLQNVPFHELRAEFQQQIRELRKVLLKNAQPKKLMNKTITGPMLLALAEAYVDSFNDGKMPAISTAWERVVEQEYESALQSGTEQFQKLSKQSVENCAEKDELQNGYIDNIHQVYVTMVKSNQLQANFSPYWSRLFKQIQQLYAKHAADLDSKSNQNCQLLWQSLTRKNDDPLVPDSEGTFEALSNELDAHERKLNDLVEQYNTQGKGPKKDCVFAQLLPEQLFGAMLEWGKKVARCYHHESSSLQKEINLVKQKVVAVESKEKILHNLLSQQKDSYAKALSSAQQRMQVEADKSEQENIERNLERERLEIQIEKINTYQSETLRRLDDQLSSLLSTKERLESLEEAERDRRDTEVSTTSRELLHSERKFHTEEKVLLTGQQEMLTQVVQSERIIGNQSAEHLQACYDLEQKLANNMNKLKSNYAKKKEKLKHKIKDDIKHSKKTHESTMLQLTADRNEKIALKATYEEKYKMAKRQGGKKVPGCINSPRLSNMMRPKMNKNGECSMQ